MKKSFIIKPVISVLILLIITMQASAEGIANKLSGIIITKADDYTYSLNLVFNDDFKDKAFMQASGNGRYTIFIPDTAKAEKKIKIKNKFKKMPAIKVSVDEKPYVKNDKETSYLKLNINTEPDYSVKLVSVKEKPSAPLASVFRFIFNSLMVCSLLTAVIASFLFMKRKKSSTHTVFPAQFGYNDKNGNAGVNDKKYKDDEASVSFLPKKTISAGDKNSFSCFDLQKNASIPTGQNYQMQSSIKKTSVITNNPANQTNPIRRNITEDLSEFNMPFVNEIDKNGNNNIENRKQDVLSVLNITPSKGFFLKEENGGFCLYGFISEKSFLLKRFADLHRINLQARFYDQDSRYDIYIIKLDSYKAMIEISEAGMKELAVL